MQCIQSLDTDAYKTYNCQVCYDVQIIDFRGIVIPLAIRNTSSHFLLICSFRPYVRLIVVDCLFPILPTKISLGYLHPRNSSRKIEHVQMMTSVRFCIIKCIKSIQLVCILFQILPIDDAEFNAFFVVIANS